MFFSEIEQVLELKCLDFHWRSWD